MITTSHTRRSRFITWRSWLGVGLSYALFWGITNIFGTVSVRSLVTVRAAEDPKLSICDKTFGNSTQANAIGNANLSQGHYCRSRAIAPFLVELSLGNRCGPACGSGGSYWLLWFPGAKPTPIYAPYRWVA